MEQRRRTTVVVAVAIAAATLSGYVLGSLVAGFAVSQGAMIAALLAAWACVAVLAAWPRSTQPRVAPQPTVVRGRELDRVSGLPFYDPADDALVAGETPWAAIVVEVDDHLAAHALHRGAADVLVAEAAERVASVAASYGASARRLQGPHFLVLVTGHDDHGIAALAATLHDGPGTAAGPGRLVVGAAISHHAVTDVPAVTRSAMTAAAQAKRLGTEAPLFFHPHMAEEARERMTVGRALRNAIDGRDIDLVYQPQLDLRDGSLVGVEVLARWHDAVHGPIAPDRFVRIAAELGLSRQLDRLICEKAFEQLAAWDRSGPDVPRICLNLSPQTVADTRPIGLDTLLATYGICAERVTVELIESRALEGEDGAMAVQRLRELGMQVALDDFGSSTSSFSQLLSLPVTGIKIDRTFLAGVEAAPDGSVLASIIQVGTALGLAVSAVGIETDAQRDLLRELGCPVGQGYLFAHPLSAAELAAWVERRQQSRTLVG